MNVTLVASSPEERNKAALDLLCSQCQTLINGGVSHITFTLPVGQTMRIKGFGRGELLSINPKGERNVMYDVFKVLKTIRQALGT